MKKTISLILALCLTMTLAAVGVSAEGAQTTTTDSTGTTQTASEGGATGGTGTAGTGAAITTNGTGTVATDPAAGDTAGAGAAVATDPAAAAGGTQPLPAADGTQPLVIPGADSAGAGTAAAPTADGTGLPAADTGASAATGADSAGTGTTVSGAGTTVNGAGTVTPAIGITTVTTSTGSDSTTTTTGTGTTSGGTASGGTTSGGTAGPIAGGVSGGAANSAAMTQYPADGKTRQTNVILRKEADAKSKKLATFSKKGQELTVNGEETVDGVLWYSVTSPKGKEGYVQGIYISVEETDRINAIKKSGAAKKMEVTVEASCADYQGLGKTWTKTYEINGVELPTKSPTVELAPDVEFSYLTLLVNKNANGVGKETYTPSAGDITSGFTRTHTVTAVSKKGKQVPWTITFTFMPEGTAAAAKKAAQAESASSSSGTTTTTTKKATSTGSKQTTSTKKEVVTYSLDAASDKPAEAVARKIHHYEEREMQVTERVQTGTKTYYAYETDEKGKSVMVEKTKPVYTTQVVTKMVSVPVYEDELPPGYVAPAGTTTTPATTTTGTADSGTTAAGTGTTVGAGTTAAGATTAPAADDLEEETMTETVAETTGTDAGTAATVPATTAATTTPATVPAATADTTAAATATTTTAATVPATTTDTTAAATVPATTTDTTAAATTTAATVPATTTDTSAATTTTTTAATVPDATTDTSAATTATTTTTATVPAATTDTTAATTTAAAPAGGLTKDQLTAQYNLIFFGPVANDVTGNLRTAQYFSMDSQEKLAADYYRAFFTGDSEIHALINPMTQTTAKISVVGGTQLLIVIYGYVSGEETDADSLFTGTMTGAYQVNLTTGEIINMMPAG